MAPASVANNGINGVNGNDALLALLASLQPENRHAFLQPDAALPTNSLNIVKSTLESVAAQVSDLQQAAVDERRKRKRAGEKLSPGDVLKTKTVHVDNLETHQVLHQARKIIGSVLKFSEAAVDKLEENNEIVNGSESEDEEPTKTLTFDEDGFEVDSDEEEDDEQLVDGEVDSQDEDGEVDFDDEEEEGGVDIDGEEDDDALLDGDEVLDEDEEEDEDEDEGDEEEGGEFVEDPNGLNDGFFSIDDFNKQSQWFETQDARGDPNTDHASDDEEIDWAADPMAPSDPKPKNKSKNEEEPLEDEDDYDEDDEDGPTFGDMALDAPEGASDDDMDLDEGADEDEGMDFNANEVYYKDFFAPPSRKGKGGRGGKPSKPKKARIEATQPTEEDTERAMADVRRDLFDDESEADDSEDALSDVSAGDPKSRRSAHERRQAKLAEEIRKLEAESVAKREWTLSGEATAVDRPMNSLLEQDLDFEHVGKPVPVITPEVSESIEELIKRRILSQEFDEVPRRRPDTEGLPSNTRRGLVELDDSKPNKSLAEVYEEEHVKNTNPDTYVSKSDEKLQKEEKEIEEMWKQVCARLDSLSSWHYKPKPTAASLSVVADVATVSMEDAQPTTAQGVTGESSRMAPQEIYKAGADPDSVAKGEVVTRAGLPVARQEMSREDKTRRRRRHKERVRKAGGADAQKDKNLSTRAKMQRDTMAELKKGGVKVINRKGEITDVEGNKAKAVKVASSGSFKL